MTGPERARLARFRWWMLVATVVYASSAVVWLTVVLAGSSRTWVLAGAVLSVGGFVLNVVALVSLREKR